MTTQLNLIRAAHELETAGAAEFTSTALLEHAYPGATASQQSGRHRAIDSLVQKGILVALLSEEDEAWMWENEENPVEAIALIHGARSAELANQRLKHLHYRMPHH